MKLVRAHAAKVPPTNHFIDLTRSIQTKQMDGLEVVPAAEGLAVAKQFVVGARGGDTGDAFLESGDRHTRQKQKQKWKTEKTNIRCFGI